MIALAVALLLFPALLIADAALTVPGEKWGRTPRPGRLALTIGLALALPLVGAAQLAILATRPLLAPAVVIA